MIISKYDLEKFVYDNQTKMIKINDTTNKEYKIVGVKLS